VLELESAEELSELELESILLELLLELLEKPSELLEELKLLELLDVLENVEYAVIESKNAD